MIDALTIRLAGPEDNVAISRVHQASIRGLCSTHYDPEQIAVWAARHTPEFYARVLDSHELFVAERDGQVVAFGQLDLENGTISSVYVAPEAARHGVGQAMLRHLEGVAQMHGWSRVHLIASMNAVGFCEKQGYEPVAPFMQQVSNDVTLECVTMRKALPRA